MSYILKHKFKAKSCEYDQKNFPSKLEKNCYIFLDQEKKEGRILFFLRQVGFDLAGSTRHFVDFCVFTKEEVFFVDSKGRDLPMGILKRKQVEDTYNIKIYIVKNITELANLLITLK